MEFTLPHVDEVLWGIGYLLAFGALAYWLVKPSKKKRGGRDA